jgi:aromatic ring-opening dioxygenase catalytic subunit (LigB family)
MTDVRRAGDRAQILYFSHGGGPLPILGDPGHRAMIDFLKKLASQLVRPEAVLVISAHWEETVATVTGGSSPSLFYDYYGFPAEAYEITYPAPGSPRLAGHIVRLLQESAIRSRLDTERGFDHGMFIPLKLMYPEADIPSVQLSLIRGLDPMGHLALGRALDALKKENILIVGSGFSFHNMGAFSWGGASMADARNDSFQNWLIDVCTGQNTEKERQRLLAGWEKAPSARYCHPREEHLLPLHVCVGMAGGQGKLVFDDYILGKRAIAVQW